MRFLHVGLGIAFVVGDIIVIRTVFVANVVALVNCEFVVDGVFSGAEVLLVDGSFVGLEKTPRVDGPKLLKKEANMNMQVSFPLQ